MGIPAGRRAAAGAVALTFVLASPAFGGASDPTFEARAETESVRRELMALLDDFEEVALAADEAARRWMDLRLREIEARVAEQEADLTFSDRVRSAYIAGAGHAIELVLGAKDLHEVAARLPYVTSALAVQRLDVRELAERREALEDVLRGAADAQQDLLRTEDKLAALRTRIETRLARAEAAVRSNTAALAALGEVRAHYEGTVDRVAGATRTIRHRKGEEMFRAAAPFLGPRANCSVPKGLRSTGDVISGNASWYGNAFRGKPTASGAIFYPERYTVAHRTLPFGLFLLVRMGNRCVVSFLNDRGPYVDGRILDLSYASAQAVGLTGVKGVSATLLVHAT